MRSAMGEEDYYYNHPRSEVEYLYQDDDKNAPKYQGKYIVEMKKSRPDWFPANLKTKVWYIYVSLCVKSEVSTVLKNVIEPQHDKTNKVTVCPAKTRISLGILRTQAFFLRTAKTDQTGQMPDDLCLCWAHSHFISFVMRRLIFYHQRMIEK